MESGNASKKQVSYSRFHVHVTCQSTPPTTLHTVPLDF